MVTKQSLYVNDDLWNSKKNIDQKNTGDFGEERRRMLLIYHHCIIQGRREIFSQKREEKKRRIISHQMLFTVLAPT